MGGREKLGEEMVLSLGKGNLDFLGCQPFSHLSEMWAGLLSHRPTTKCRNEIKAQHWDGARGRDFSSAARWPGQPSALGWSSSGCPK